MGVKYVFNVLTGKFDEIQDVSGFVPYTGATAALNMGANAITATIANLSAATAQIVFDSAAAIKTVLQDSAATTSKTITLPNFTGTLYISGGTDVTVADGGTGLSAVTAYMPIAGGTTTTGNFQSVAIGTQYYPLVYNTSSSLPSFTLLPVAGGGTGRATDTAYAMIAGGTTTTAAQASIANSALTGAILRSAGTNSYPAWSTATYPGTTTANRILYSSSANVVGEIAAPTITNTYLKWDGASYTWNYVYNYSFTCNLAVCSLCQYCCYFVCDIDFSMQTYCTSYAITSLSSYCGYFLCHASYS